MATDRPRCLILAGPNGAGKSTHARTIVSGHHRIERFINPDAIAGGLGGFALASANFDAGRIALLAIAQSIAGRQDFAFETTLAGRRWPSLLDRLRDAGFNCLVSYLWIPDVELSIERVRRRVLAGGHDIPESDIRRRHASSLANFRTHFLPRASMWRVFDASSEHGLVGIASGGLGTPTLVADAERWRKIVESPHSSRVREVSREQMYVTQEGDQFSMDAQPANRSTEPDTSVSTRVPLMASLEEMVATSPAAVRRALAIQRALGVSAAAMRDGKIVIIPPEELPLTAYDSPSSVL